VHAVTESTGKTAQIQHARTCALRLGPPFRNNEIMNLLLWTISGAVLLQNPDPLQLQIGAQGKLTVKPGEIVRTIDGKSVTVDQVAAEADGLRFVFLGESHTSAAHHIMQADVIEALARRGRQVVVGFEMFTRPVQQQLNPWTLGWWTEQEFIDKADWKGQWGFDFALYRPIFEVIRKNKIPMAALNLPRDWVRRVGRQGLSGLTEDERRQFPMVDVNNKDHRSVFNALMGGHPPTGAQGENIYTAQVLWDTAMADSAMKFLERYPVRSNVVFVVLAGSGHVMYGQGINYQIWKRTGEKGLTMVMAESNEPTPVSKGLADFVFVSKEKS
jgi:uncharacterized iron-regulated protein